MLETPIVDELKLWLREDPVRWQALQIAAELDLPDWCLAAGFVRNLVWDKLHGYQNTTPLRDIDLIYFDPGHKSKNRDLAVEKQLIKKIDLPWSVKNQARMHLRHGHKPYASTIDAMCYWPEVETAVGVKLLSNERLDFISPFGFEMLMANSITYNQKNSHYQSFLQRLENKQWLQTWPRLSVNFN